MASEYQAAGVRTGHNIYVLRAVVEDLLAGFANNAAERRHISASRQELSIIAAVLTKMIVEIDLANTAQPVVQKLDPRDPDPSREGMFRYHNCWRCRHGKLPCAQGNARTCSNPHARDD